MLQQETGTISLTALLATVKEVICDPGSAIGGNIYFALLCPSSNYQQY